MSVIDVTRVSKCFTMHPDRPRSFQHLVVNAFKRQPQRARKETFWALRDLSFSVEAGETLGIIGSNGSGKSTCLKLLTRIIEPTTGKVSVQGRISALLELGAGFHPELTGRENITLYGSVLGLHRRDMAQRFDAIVSFAELERFIDIPVKFYSSGMYVRLAFATAINVSPDVLLVDEVLAVGDQSFQTRCLDHISDLKARGVTIVFVSHSLESVSNLCSRAIWLDQGSMRDDGLTDGVVARYLEHIHDKEEEQASALLQAERASAASASAPREGQPSEPGAGAEAPVGDMAASPGTEAGPSAEPLERRHKRWGTREAEITAVRFLDAEGQECALLTTGASASIAIRYRAHHPIEDPVFGVALHRNDGLHMSGSNTFLAHFDIPRIEGEGEVRYKMDAVPLLEGVYYLTVAIHNSTQTHTYDYQNFAFRFRVHMGTITERWGTIFVPAHWEHLPGPTPGDKSGPP